MGVYVPERLKRIDSWAVWRKEPVPGEGKTRKCPYSAQTGIKSGEVCDYLTARRALEYGVKGADFDGLGFWFDESQGLVFVDLDSCCNDMGEVNGFANGILNEIGRTYTEYSQSGSGLHIVCEASYKGRLKRPEIEIYGGKQFCAMTFDVYTPAEPANAETAIQAIVKRFQLSEKKTANYTHYCAKHPISPDTVVIARIRRARGSNADDFARLYDKGDIARYPSASEADYRLADIIFFYTRDEQQTERIFSQSALARRKKALRNDYIARTVAAVSKHYSERRK